MLDLQQNLHAPSIKVNSGPCAATCFYRAKKKEVAALIRTKQTTRKYWRGSETRSHSTSRWKDLLKAHSNALGCVSRHIHAQTQFPAEHRELFEERFQQSAGKLSRDASPWRLHSYPGSTFRGADVRYRRFDGMIQQLLRSQMETERKRLD